MSFSLSNLKISNKINLNEVLPKSGEIALEKANQLDEFMKTLIAKIGASASATVADKMLLDISKNSKNLKMLDYTMFQHGEYNIITCLSHFGEPTVRNLKILEKLKLDCVPELVTTISKDNSLYIITRHKGTQNGNLKQYFVDGINKVSSESKLKAYKDFQKLTKAGLIDDKYLRAGNWYYTPENKIFLPTWDHLRQIRQDESSKDIVQQYYNIIFGK